MQNFTRLIVAALLVATPLSARAETYATVQGWEIGKGDDDCYAALEYEGDGDTVLLLNVDVDGTILLMLSNYGWSAEEDKAYENMEFILGETAFSGGKAIGFASDGRKGFVTGFPAKFLDHFAAANSFRAYLGETLVDQLSLKGSGAAVASLRRCVASLKAVKAAEEREKARLSHIPKDPFASAPK